jgi:hypothetical protein
MNTEILINYFQGVNEKIEAPKKKNGGTIIKQT